MSKPSFAIGALGAALVSAGIALGAQAENLSSADHQFADKAAIGGMAEVAAGKLAQDKAQDSTVREFGQRMVQDHSQANDRLKQIAAAKGMTLPTKLDKHAQQEIDKFTKLSGDEFDRSYIKAQVSDHEKVISEFEKEASSGKDSALVQFAKTTLPTLREHLKLAESAEQEVMGKSASDMKNEKAKNLAAAKEGTNATHVNAGKEDRMPVPNKGM